MESTAHEQHPVSGESLDYFFGLKCHQFCCLWYTTFILAVVASVNFERWSPWTRAMHHILPDCFVAIAAFGIRLGIDLPLRLSPLFHLSRQPSSTCFLLTSKSLATDLWNHGIMLMNIAFVGSFYSASGCISCFGIITLWSEFKKVMEGSHQYIGIRDTGGPY